MRTPPTLVCPETLAGGLVELVPQGNGRMKCRWCGADEDVIRYSAELVQADWLAGGPGYREPRPDEKVEHRR